MRSIFIFRRDLRFYDNTGLIKALSESDVVYPIFIFTPEQIKNNRFKSDNAVQFMVSSLLELKSTAYFYGDNVKVLTKLVKNNGIDRIYVNEDYTPYSVKRDNKIRKLCKKLEIEFIECTDLLLQPDNYKKDGNQYLIFTPFYKNAEKKKVDKPVKNGCKNYKKMTGGLKKGDLKKFYEHNDELILNGGRKEGLGILRGLVKFKNYNKERNIPSINTTRLSAHLKFGTLSVREVYYKFMKVLGKKNDLVKQLYWRDFYMRIIFHFPDLYKSNTRPEMNKIKWNNTSKLSKWKEGMTGIPIVDAGMREMNETGFMHNRVRMIVATFLIFNLGINWKRGEEYFSQKLIDSDVANNNGNWKWVAGVEKFSNDYYKAMSMESQTKRFDPDGEYIKTWCPELEDVEAKHLYNWDKHNSKYDVDYPKPIVDIFETRKDTIKLYKKYM